MKMFQRVWSDVISGTFSRPPTPGTGHERRLEKFHLNERRDVSSVDASSDEAEPLLV